MNTRFSSANYNEIDKHLLYRDSVGTIKSIKMKDTHIICPAFPSSSSTSRFVFYIYSRLLVTGLQRAKKQILFHGNVKFCELQ